MNEDNKLIHRLNEEEPNFIEDLKCIVERARNHAYTAINYAQVTANWLIGQRIVKEEQQGATRAEYGKHVIEMASEALTKEYGRGYSITNIKNFRRFYFEFQHLGIQQTVSAESEIAISQTASDQLGEQFRQTVSALLPWSHYERLMRVENLQARKWYEQEAIEQMWSYRTLDRNISTQYYERLLLSQTKEPVVEEMRENTQEYQTDKLAFIKNPTVLEFLGLPNNKAYKEQELENAILTNLQEFLMEMGKGFAFVGRQKLMRTDTEDYYIDLVFFNYILNCFVLIDLKVGKITHQDVGQMDMYVRMFDELKRGEGHNPTIGIVLCSETSKDIARYSILKGNEQLFATKYKLLLPTPEELQAEIESQKQMFLMQKGIK